jgi:hypothetical protein
MDKHVEVRGKGADSARIDPGNPAASRTSFIKLIENAFDRGGTIVMLFP